MTRKAVGAFPRRRSATPAPAPPHPGSTLVSDEVIPSSSADISRSTTACRPSLPPKCSQTTGLDTLALISSIDVRRNRVR